MPFHRFPHDFVYWDQVKDHDIIKRDLLPLIQSYKSRDTTNKPGLVNAYTNFYLKSESEPECKELQHPLLVKEIWRILDEAVLNIFDSKTSFKPKISTSRIKNYWYTHYHKNGSFQFHCHSNNEVFHLDDGIYHPTFSMIYILNDENEKNVTTFSKLDQRIPLFNLPEYHFDTKNVKEIKEGTLLIFPSTLYHKVDEVEKPGRVTLAFNIVSK